MASVDSVEIDMSVDPHKAREMGAKAMKLLVLWREDEPAEERLAMVDKFVRRCRSAGWLALLNLWCVHLVAVGTLIVKAPLLPPPQSLVEQRLIFTKPRCH